MKRAIFGAVLIIGVIGLWLARIQAPSKPSAQVDKGESNGVWIDVARTSCLNSGQHYGGGYMVAYTIVYYPAINQYRIRKGAFGKRGGYAETEWGEYSKVTDAYKSIGEQPECESARSSQ